MRPPATRWIVSRTGSARIAAPCASAAAITRETSAARSSGRAASCIATCVALSGSAARPACAESWRSAPPATGASTRDGIGQLRANGGPRGERGRGQHGQDPLDLAHARERRERAREQRHAPERDERLGRRRVELGSQPRAGSGAENEGCDAHAAQLSGCGRRAPGAGCYRAAHALVGGTHAARARRGGNADRRVAVRRPPRRNRSRSRPRRRPTPAASAARARSRCMPLSLSEAIALGIENNTDVQLVRYDPPIAEYEHDAAWGAPRSRRCLATTPTRARSCPIASTFFPAQFIERELVRRRGRPADSCRGSAGRTSSATRATARDELADPDPRDDLHLRASPPASAAPLLRAPGGAPPGPRSS